mmetsp:Transcript_137017/g.273285  ORF Transcript_137017/g.273285 Transcript_137017/m.273285 type:complete len:285 (+) Transcript_137017:50-904(+)
MGAKLTAGHCGQWQCCDQEVEKSETEMFGHVATGDNTEMNFVKLSLTKLASVDDDLLPEKTDSTRSSTTASECWEAKATTASRLMRTLADSDDQRAWEQLRCEFDCQQVLWGKTPEVQQSIVHQDIIAAQKSNVEFALTMESASDAQVVYVLEAMLSWNDTMMKRLSAECPEAALPALSPSMRAAAEGILRMLPARQARYDLAAYCDEVAAMSDARFTTWSADWPTTTVKACELRHAVLKEYLNGIIAYDGRQRLLRQARLQIPSAADGKRFLRGMHEQEIAKC